MGQWKYFSVDDSHYLIFPLKHEFIAALKRFFSPLYSDTEGWIEHWLVDLYSVAMKNDYKHSGLSLLQFWGSEVWNEVSWGKNEGVNKAELLNLGGVRGKSVSLPCPTSQGSRIHWFCFPPPSWQPDSSLSLLLWPLCLWSLYPVSCFHL